MAIKAKLKLAGAAVGGVALYAIGYRVIAGHHSPTVGAIVRHVPWLSTHTDIGVDARADELDEYGS